MTAKIIPFPSQGRVQLKRVDSEREELPLAVRQLMAIMDATERKYGSVLPPPGVSVDDQIRLAFPDFKRTK
jgi:hypothetical protein